MDLLADGLYVVEDTYHLNSLKSYTASSCWDAHHTENEFFPEWINTHMFFCALVPATVTLTPPEGQLSPQPLNSR